ncbi:MAG: DUF6496 domain-containing protein [Candidimonas sp.]
MPKKEPAKLARQDKREGKSPQTQAGHFVGQEVHDMKKHESAAKTRKQAIAIGLSKAREAGVEVPKKKAASKKK